jgi:hypothetical protein
MVRSAVVSHVLVGHLAHLGDGPAIGMMRRIAHRAHDHAARIIFLDLLEAIRAEVLPGAHQAHLGPATAEDSQMVP